MKTKESILKIFVSILLVGMFLTNIFAANPKINSSLQSFSEEGEWVPCFITVVLWTPDDPEQPRDVVHCCDCEYIINPPPTENEPSGDSPRGPSEQVTYGLYQCIHVLVKSVDGLTVCQHEEQQQY